MAAQALNNTKVHDITGSLSSIKKGRTSRPKCWESSGQVHSLPAILRRGQ